MGGGVHRQLQKLTGQLEAAWKEGQVGSVTAVSLMFPSCSRITRSTLGFPPGLWSPWPYCIVQYGAVLFCSVPFCTVNYSLS